MKQESSELTILKYQNCTLFVSKHQAYNLDTFYFRSFFSIIFSKLRVGGLRRKKEEGWGKRMRKRQALFNSAPMRSSSIFCT
jgi:hypothetical protein